MEDVLCVVGQVGKREGDEEEEEEEEKQRGVNTAESASVHTERGR